MQCHSIPRKKAENSQDNVEDEQRTTHLTLPDTKIYIQLLQLYQCGAGKTQGKIKKPMEYESRVRHTHTCHRSVRKGQSSQ